MRVAVVGTGTEVGKTYVTCALARRLVADGRRCRALKPIESGLGTGGRARDAEALAAAAGHEVVAPRFGFERPVSPHLEARRVGVAVTREAVVSWVEEHEGGITLVETAGGLLSPLGPDATNLDLVGWLAAEVVVLVAPDRLGVLHDVAAVKRVLEGVGLWGRTRLVVSGGAGVDASTGTNGAELVGLGVVEEVVELGRGGELEAGDAAWLVGVGLGGVGRGG